MKIEEMSFVTRKNCIFAMYKIQEDPLFFAIINFNFQIKDYNCTENSSKEEKLSLHGNPKLR